MTDTVTSQTIQDGPKKAIMHFTSISDGTGEGTAVKKVDVSALAPLQGIGGEQVCDEVRVMKIIFATSGMPVRILWSATTNEPMVTLGVNGGSDSGVLDYSDIGGLKNPKATGWDGDIDFLVLAAAADAGDSYSVTLVMEKKYAGS